MPTIWVSGCALTEALADPELRAEATEAIPSLVGEVMPMPGTVAVKCRRCYAVS